MSRQLTASLTVALAALALPAYAALAPGDLIKASGAAVYYRAEDGKRYVFPTEKTYQSWYTDFTGVKTISDAELSALAIGGNVTYRPGVKLLKITTDPKVYAVDGRMLRWIKTEALAKQLYGNDWAKLVDDLPDPFFVNYKLGADIATSTDYAPTSTQNAYPTIQTSLASTLPAPTSTTPTPTSTAPAPTSTAISVTITTNKPTAQANETIDVLAQTDYTNGIERIDIFVDDALYRTCLSAKSCSMSWTVPVAATKSSYTYRAKLLTMDGKTTEATTSTAIVSMPIHSSIQVSAERTTIRPNQQPYIRSLVIQGLSVAKNEIYVDNHAVKVCATYDCRYTDYLSGAVGSTHTVFSIVTTPNALKYKSNILTLTIGTNDTPAVTFSPSKTEIFSGETVDLVISASDDDGIKGLDILKDGAALKTCTGPAPCSVTTGPWSVTSSTALVFEGRAYDLLSATGTASVTVTVK